MQEIEVPPRDCFKYYVHVDNAPKTIMWNFSTKRKNISFGLFYQNEPVSLQNGDVIERVNESEDDRSDRTRGSTLRSDTSSDATAGNNSRRMRKKSGPTDVAEKEPYLVPVLPVVRYESAKLTIKGEKVVTQNGTYVLYFDNSFSMNTSKKLTFFVALKDGEPVTHEHKPELSGYMLKKKRKKMQGWARRWFVIDRGQLSYYVVPNGVCRGSVPIALSTISVDKQRMWINIDSGSSLWHLRALNPADFDQWLTVIRSHKAVAIDYFRTKSDSQPGTPPNELNGDTNSLYSNSAGESDLTTEVIGLDRVLSTFENELSNCRDIIADFKTRNEILDHKEKDGPKGSQGRAGLIKKITKRGSGSSEDVSAFQPHVPSSLDDLSRAIAQLQTQFTSTKHFLLDVYAKELAHRRNLEIAYLKVYNENVAFRAKLGYRQNETHSSSTGIASEKAQSPQQRTNSLTSSFSEVFYDAEEIEFSGQPDDSDDGSVSDQLEELVIFDETFDDEDSDDDSDDEDSNVGAGLLPPISSKVPSISRTASTASSLQTKNQSQAKPNSQNGTSEQSYSPIVRRKLLPAPVTGDSVSLVSILRKNVGKDLSTISMPISLNEPLNLLQRLCEELEYSELLDQAASCDDSVMRLAYIAAFAVSGYSSTVSRASRKPFNPLHGETYECERVDKGFRYISEKVSHNPPIMACHAESLKGNYSFWQESKVKSKFWGKSMEFIPSGNVHVTLNKWGEQYTWSKVTTCMRNLISGPKSLDHYGSMTITNHSTGEYAVLTFKENSSGYFSSNNGTKNEVAGVLYNSKKEKIKLLTGRWSDTVWICDIDDRENLVEIWRVNEDNQHIGEDMYGLTRFAIELNEITPDLPPYLPPTDTRYRPDQRLFEEGNLTEAETEKIRLEEKQRTVRRALQNEGKSITPLWFRKQMDEITKTEEWCFAGDYWKKREAFKGKSKDNWMNEAGCLDLFS